MSSYTIRGVLAFGAALAILGSVLFSRFTIPDAASRDPKGTETLLAVDIPLTKQSEVAGLSPAGEVSDTVAESTTRNPKKSNSSPTPRLTTRSPASLTDEEIFQIQHPQYYLDYLRTIEDRMISDGYLPEGNHATFTGEAEVLQFWREKGFGFFLSKGIIDEAERFSFFLGIEEVKRLHAEEVQTLNDFYRGTRSGKASKIGAVPAWVQSLFRIGRGFLEPTTANAQTCFQEGVKSFTPGVNLIAPCCACSVLGAPIGCLNLMCAGRDAIFDQTTFICGCG